MNFYHCSFTQTHRDDQEKDYFHSQFSGCIKYHNRKKIFFQRFSVTHVLLHSVYKWVLATSEALCCLCGMDNMVARQQGAPCLPLFSWATHILMIWSHYCFYTNLINDERGSDMGINFLLFHLTGPVIHIL